MTQENLETTPDFEKSLRQRLGGALAQENLEISPKFVRYLRQQPGAAQGLLGKADVQPRDAKNGLFVIAWLWVLSCGGL
ncbi:hypothetical protein [Bifidobacterium jacchi]|uniref:hypothetical protein n=1 Tax=Bifidobacterium jacchi TaxID=2490545 RepID=UPI00125EFE9E|nr:hypothetical protein [Bifidobacterium jacchi]